jgi:hypothetical protein
VGCCRCVVGEGVVEEVFSYGHIDGHVREVVGKATMMGKFVPSSALVASPQQNRASFTASYRISSISSARAAGYGYLVRKCGRCVCRTVVGTSARMIRNLAAFTETGLERRRERRHCA